MCTVCAAAVLLTHPPAFIEPFFLSGMHLAFTGTLSAMVMISLSIRSVVRSTIIRISSPEFQTEVKCEWEIDVEVDIRTGKTYMLFKSYICAVESQGLNKRNKH